MVRCIKGYTPFRIRRLAEQISAVATERRRQRTRLTRIPTYSRTTANHLLRTETNVIRLVSLRALVSLFVQRW